MSQTPQFPPPLSSALGSGKWVSKVVLPWANDSQEGYLQTGKPSLSPFLQMFQQPGW